MSKAFADGLCAHEPRLGPRTIRDIVLVAKMILQSAVDADGNFLYAVKWNEKFLDLPRPGPTKTNGTDAKCIERLIRELPPRYALVYATAAATGMRLGEILALKIADEGIGTSSVWDGANKIIHVRQSVYRGVLQHPKTVSSVRTIEICEKLNDVIAHYTQGRTRGFLFASKTGTAIAPRIVYARLAGSGIHGMHAFRRFRVTHLVDRAVPVEIIKSWIGHSKIDITEKYSRLADRAELRREWVEKVGLGFTF